MLPARTLVVALLGALAMVAGPLASSAMGATLTFTPEADTYVDSSLPNDTYGTSTGMWVDGSPQKQAFMRFRVAGLAGRQVLGAKLRLYQRDASPLGGRVFSMSSTTWAESATWQTRPAIDGPQRGSFGAVQSGAYYEAGLGAFISSDGAVSLAVDSTNSDGARWSTRESSSPPQLVLEVGDAPTAPLDGLTQVAAPNFASSDPTYYGTNKRLALTSAGRLLTVHGRHGSGVQLAWRDPGSSAWQRTTTGAVSSGALLSGTGTGDWPASIEVAKDAGGVERAWVVWGRNNHNVTSYKVIQMARLSDLDSPQGPTVGPVQTIDATELGPFKPDIAFERAPDGSMRGALVWSRKTGDSTYAMVTAWFTDLGTDAPAITTPTTILSSTTSSRYGGLVSTPAGLRLVARGASGRMTVYTHDASAPLTSWTAAPGGLVVSGFPSATSLDSGELLAAVESNTTDHVVNVQRFSATGAPSPAELQLTGYAQPTIATDGARAWIVMVRLADGYVVSRQYTPGSGWSTTDRVEIGAEGGGNHGWPNAVRRTDGRLRFVVRGPVGPTTSSVLAFQRSL